MYEILRRYASQNDLWCIFLESARHICYRKFGACGNKASKGETVVKQSMSMLSMVVRPHMPIVASSSSLSISSTDTTPASPFTAKVGKKL